jgi:hypothetical protein
MNLASRLGLPPKVVKFYTYIENLEDLQLGRYIRWLKTDNLKKLFNGGFLVSIGDVCTCKNAQGNLFTFVFDDCLVFQRMSNDEIIIKYAAQIAEQES